MRNLKEHENNHGKSGDIIVGKNAIAEALRAGRPIDRLLVARGQRSARLNYIIAQCKEKGITIKEVSPAKLDNMCGATPHQGVAAVCAVHDYSTLDDIIKAAQSKGQPPFIIIADGIEDPHNLGAIIRTAEASGAHGVIIPKRRSAGLSFVVGKASAGAIEHIPVARVTNLTSVIEELKKKGLWIYGADITGETWYSLDYKGPLALVIGSEGKGISRLVKEKCDFLVSLPMMGKINSLNASVAGGIIMYEVLRQRS